MTLRFLVSLTRRQFAVAEKVNKRVHTCLITVHILQSCWDFNILSYFQQSVTVLSTQFHQLSHGRQGSSNAMGRGLVYVCQKLRLRVSTRITVVSWTRIRRGSGKCTALTTLSSISPQCTTYSAFAEEKVINMAQWKEAPATLVCFELFVPILVHGWLAQFACSSAAVIFTILPLRWNMYDWLLN